MKYGSYLKLDIKDLELVKETARERYKTEGKGKLTEGQFMALCYIHACNQFFKKYGFETLLMFTHPPYPDPDDDRIA